MFHWHMGRSFVGTALEDDCPCGKAPCGLVDSNLISAGCDRHFPTEATKTMRQIYDAGDCPRCCDLLVSAV